MLVLLGHSTFSLSICPRSEVSLLKKNDALLYITAPLGMIQCLSLPVIDVNIIFLQIGLQGVHEFLLLPTSKAITISELGI